ncbi:MAG: PAS domain-containing protein [Leptospirales bacterium]
MGFFLFTRSLRDTSASKKVLEMVVNDNQTACFVVNEEGRIVIFNDTLSFLLQWSISALARKPFLEVLRHLVTQGQDEISITLPDPGSFFDSFATFKNFGKRGALLLKGYSLGGLPPPSGIYFLTRYGDLPTERDKSQILLPMVDKFYARSQPHLATLTVDDFDLKEVERISGEILETLNPLLQHIRIFLVDRISLDDSTHFARILYDGPSIPPQESLEGVLYGDTLYFQKLSSHSVRPVLVEHTDLPWQYEILFPFSWFHHVFGWMGIPVSSLEVWKDPVRFRWQDALRDLGTSLGLRRSRLELLPDYLISEEGVMEAESLEMALDFMVSRTPPRPFVLLLFELKEMRMRTEFSTLLSKAKRGTDFLGLHPLGLVAVFPDEDPAAKEEIADRYRKLLERLIVSDFRFQCNIFSHAFPAREWTGRELLGRLSESPGVSLKPSADIVSDDIVFDDWFKNFLLLKDFE